MISVRIDSRLSAFGLVALALATPLGAQAPGATRGLGPASSNLLVPRYLGGFARRASSTTTPPQEVFVLQSRAWGTGFGVEPFGGTWKPRDGYRMPEQDLGGVLAGLHFGRDLALRGYYWRGWNRDSSDTAPIQSYGGELQVGLFGGVIVHPFLIGGAGYVDYLDDYRDLDGEAREDEETLIAGAGIAVRPLKWLELNAAVRSYFLQSPGPKDDWLSNWVWTVGVSFRLGGTPSKSPYEQATGTAAAAGTATGTQMASFPVPASGEIRVLYGGDTLRAGDSAVMRGTMAVGATTIEAVKAVVAAELAYLDALNPDAATLGAPRGPLTRPQADTLTRRLGYRTNEIFDYILRGQAQAIHAAMRAELTSRGVDEASQVRVLAKVDSVLNDRLAYNLARTREIRLLEDSAYARAAREAAAAAQRYLVGGLGGFGQFYLDGRASFRSGWLENLRIVPQATLGFSSTTTAMIGVSAQYHGKTSSGWTPYVGLGIGALVRGGEIEGESGTSFVLNPALGLQYASKSASVFGKTATGYYLEVQGVDLFDSTRLLAGITWRF
ncbi:MAG TPA: hypothetical protein VF862_12710 [Gemmatimonadales bacterium]